MNSGEATTGSDSRPWRSSGRDIGSSFASRT
jgi:hypothetical protein